jgi:flagellar L-ring protein precursor FlgH
MNKPFSLFSKLASLAVAVTVCGGFSAGADSLWDEESSRSMFADKRASAVGDILTIVVQENNAASKEATTKTAKKSGVDASIQSFLYGPAASGLLTKGGQYPAMKFSAKNDFEGGGQINNSEKITARIAVRVVDVLPNKNLVVEGRRQTSFSGEVQDVVLRGVVRAEDVTANNTVFSYQVADATITILSKGSVSNTQKKGWFTRVWDKISPF